MNKLWQKDWQLDGNIEAFETGGDLVLDQKLVKADVLGSLVHAKMLSAMGFITNKELEEAQTGLKKILDQVQKGTFILAPGDEDVHTKIENLLTEWYGPVGKKIHTARSRNDQVATAVRLYTKEQLLFIWGALLSLIEEFLLFAKKYEMVPMPGYTHLQKAMPSSVGMWAGSFTESFLDSLILFKAGYKLNNQSPLGSVAAYGVPTMIDREYTAELLGFAKVQQNSLYCQNSRGIIEASVVAGLIPMLQAISKFASDILLFTTSEFHLFSVDETMCSGSSIMPQKKNVDIAELLRAKVHSVLANYVALVSIPSNLPSGYNRDLQETKKPLFESFDMTLGSLTASKILLEHLIPNTQSLERAMTPELFATGEALNLVSQGLPFRDAYQKVGQSLNSLPKPTIFEITESLSASKHTGGTGNLGLAHLYSLLYQEKSMYEKEKGLYEESIKNIFAMI